MANNFKIFAGSATKDLAEKVAGKLGTTTGNVTIFRFSDGEFQPSFEDSVRGDDVFIVQSTMPPTENLFEVLQMDLSFIKFISWAIPSIGFLGTVRGIGDALGKANEAVLGDITSMTSSLGVAFNSTFVALLISIFLMFIISRLELKQDELILKLRSKSF